MDKRGVTGRKKEKERWRRWELAEGKMRKSERKNKNEE